MSKKYVQGSQIDKIYSGSIEESIDKVHAAIDEHFGDSSINIVATHDGYAYAFSEDGDPLKVTFKTKKDGSIAVVSAKPTDKIMVIEDKKVPKHVSGELRSIVKEMVEGNVTRTRVREVASLLRKDEDYWLSDVLGKINEGSGDTDWIKMYEANMEKVRTSLYGNIKEIESGIPSTRYSTIKELDQVSEELCLSIGLLKKRMSDIFDESEKVSFNSEEDFLKVVNESLRVEAQNMSAMLGKVESLFEDSHLSEMASMHDRVADRIKKMAILSEYIKKKTK